MPSRTYKLGRIAGLELTASPSCLLGSALLSALLSTIGVGLLGLPANPVVLGSLIAVLLHWLSSLIHHLGHAWAASTTGHPMIGVHFHGLLGTSVYPAGEPALPARVHIRRALGGPLASLLLAVVAGAIALAPRRAGSVSQWLALLFFLENLLAYTLQALLPLGFNDGTTLRHWWRQRQRRP